MGNFWSVTKSDQITYNVCLSACLLDYNWIQTANKKQFFKIVFTFYRTDFRFNRVLGIPKSHKIPLLRCWINVLKQSFQLKSVKFLLFSFFLSVLTLLSCQVKKRVRSAQKTWPNIYQKQWMMKSWTTAEWREWTCVWVREREKIEWQWMCVCVRRKVSSY